jgi:hypothetical protein
MFLPFFAALRREGVPVSPPEFLTFLQAVAAGIVTFDVTAFYHLARAAMVKDERHVDRFDRAFAAAFRGVEALTDEAVIAALDLPRDWLEAFAERQLTEAERAAVQALGGLPALLDALRQRLAEQKGRHEGGSKWIGTAGTSPFGAMGYNPEGIRIGQDRGREGRAVKVWDRREFRDLDADAALGPRAMKLALRRLRRWAREGTEEELDLDGTVRATAAQGWLDLRTRAPRRNAVKVLLFLDAGGSMDAHVQGVQALFSAARSAFRHLEPWYFHNCIYEGVWRENRRRHEARIPTETLLHSHGPDWKCIVVGDATMSPYELTHAGGAVEHWNAEPGLVWLSRLAGRWPHHLWINPVPERFWGHSPSVGLVRQAFGGRMVGLTLDGLGEGMRALS